MLPNPRSSRVPASLLTLLALCALLGACSSGDSTMGPEAEPDTGNNPPPAPGHSMYSVWVTLHHIEVLGTCESAAGNPGDFEYEVECWGRNATDHYVKHYRLTGSFEGSKHETFSLVGHRTQFPVPAGKNYYVSIKATDTDPWPNEDDYVGYTHKTFNAGPVDVWGGDYRIQIGDNSCGLALYFSVSEVGYD